MVTRRGFIIAIENYAKITGGLVSTLPGTHQAADDFHSWLINEQGLSSSDIYYCAEDASIAARTAGATSNDIINELAKLMKEGKDKTDELYFFYSGHGFCYTDIDGARVADVLLATDYVDYNTGRACLKITEIQRWLRLCMGSKDHFYFIDACRNDVSEKDIKVGNLGQPYNLSRLGTPTVYTLYSTVEGTTAAVNSGFAKVLIDALKGNGRAKVWRQQDMVVLFRSVKDYVASKLSAQSIDERKEGSRDGVIREVAPPPAYICEIEVQNAAPTDVFTFTVTNQRNQPIYSATFTGPKTSFTDKPDDYNLRVMLPNFIVNPIDPLPADLYDDCTVRFVKQSPIFASSGPPPSSGSGGAVNVTFHGPGSGHIVVKNLNDGLESVGTGRFTENLAAGRYVLKTLDDRGIAVDRRTITVDRMLPIDIDLTALQWSPLRDALLTRTGGQHQGGLIELSETLGPTPDQGMDLWLAIIGASRIISNTSYDFSKLSPLPLHSFVNSLPGAAPVYLLAGFDEQPGRFAAAVSTEPPTTLQPLVPHSDFPGLFELVIPSTRPGHHYLSLQLNRNVRLTTGLCTLPNRTTLVTLTSDKVGALVMQQFVLPIGPLASQLPFEARDLSRRPELRSNVSGDWWIFSANSRNRETYATSCPRTYSRTCCT